MPVWIWTDGADSSFEVVSSVEFVTSILGAAAAANEKVWLGSTEPNWVAVVDGAGVTEVISDEGDRSNDERKGIPEAPPVVQPSPTGPDNPAGVHVIPVDGGKILYVSVKAPRGHTPPHRDNPNPAPVH